MIKCALADMNNVPALVLQTDNLHTSGKLLLCETGSITPAIAMIGDDDESIYFLVYDKVEGIEEPLFVKKADQQSIDFVKHIKEDQTWVLVLQIVMLSNQESRDLPYTMISLRNIGDEIEISDPIVKEDWIIPL